MTPLVSVAMPAYNAARSLPWALGSVLAQTYTHWECIVVDDGSSDGSIPVIESFDDRRIRLIRFPANQGRPAARQAALDAAGGEYLAMLDADDWIYPEKLGRQVAAFQQHPEVGVVGSGMMIVDVDGRPAGVRATAPSRGITVLPPTTGLARPRVAHGTTMVRMSLVRRVAYDRDLPHTQDTDFLMRVMRGQSYAVFGDPLYVYTEHSSVTEEKILRSLDCNRIMYGKYLRSHPVASRLRIAGTVGRAAAYKIGFAFGLRDALLRRRSAAPTADQIDAFVRAEARVREVTESYVAMTTS
jgi:glycosyltransferase involved in cell wall biosynthesis